MVVGTTVVLLEQLHDRWGNLAALCSFVNLLPRSLNDFLDMG